MGNKSGWSYRYTFIQLNQTMVTQSKILFFFVCLFALLLLALFNDVAI